MKRRNSGKLWFAIGILIFLAVVIISSSFSLAYTPPANSPLAKGEHPRLHITPATLPALRQKVMTDFHTEYQALVNYVNANFDDDKAYGVIADYHALIYLLDIPDKTVNPAGGIDYGGKSRDDYGRRAIEIMLHVVNAGSAKDQLLLTFGASGPRDYWHEDDIHPMPRAYDWVWDKMSAEEKREIGSWLAQAGLDALVSSTGIRNGALRDVFDGAFRNARPWEMGLAIYGDGINDEAARTLIDSFQKLMLNGGWLDTQNWVARYYGANNQQIGHYGRMPLAVLELNPWKSATGENYFVKGTGSLPGLTEPYSTRDYSRFLLYQFDPAVNNLFMKWGQDDAAADFQRVTGFLRVLRGPLKESSPDMAALTQWLLETRGFAEDNMAKGQCRDCFYTILLGEKTIQPKSPSQLQIPLTQVFEGVGMIAMRTGFEDIRDTAIVVGAPTYMLRGHSWGSYGHIPLGFTIHKYGPLALKRGGYLRGALHRQNRMLFTDPTVSGEGQATGESPPVPGFVSGAKFKAPQDVFQYIPHSVWDVGGLLRFQTADQDYDYLYLDVGAHYTYVNSYTRQFVYLRPNSVDKSDYIVVFDRTETTKPEILKRWEVNAPYNPQINGQESLIKEGTWEYTGANQIAITNYPSEFVVNGILEEPYVKQFYPSQSRKYQYQHPEAHGMLFVKTLLPRSTKMRKVGGPSSDPAQFGLSGFEFADDNGNPVIHPADYAALRGKGALFTGSYYVDVMPVENNAKENFLHVLQTADAQRPEQSSAMVKTELIEASTGNMQGAFIEGKAVTGQDNAIVMFAKEERILNRDEPISYTINGVGRTRHLITDLPAGVEYEVKDITRNNVIGKFTVNDGRTNHAKDRGDSAAGVLSFTTVLGSEHTFTITPTGVTVNIPPTVKASATPQSGTAPLTVQFTATASDSDGTIVSYTWDFGDGTTGTGASVSHIYNNVGNYNAKVTVTDDKGATSNSNVVVIVNAVQIQTCGNNIREGTEQCDGTDLNGESCLSKGFSGGTLGCVAKGQQNECTFDSSGCTTATQRYQYRVKARNSVGDSEYSNVATWEEGCRLTRAYWSRTEAVEGSSVSLTVEGTNCEGQEVSFEVWEKDGFILDVLDPDDLANIQPSPVKVMIRGGRAISRWNAEHNDDGLFGGDPEYYFVSKLVDREDVKIESGLLEVRALVGPPPVPVCGNGKIETGEQCDDGNIENSEGCSANCNVQNGWECSGEPSRCTRRGAGVEIRIDSPREGVNLNRILQVKYEVLFNEELDEREFECDYVVYRKLNNVLRDIVQEGEGCEVKTDLREQDGSRLAEGDYLLEVGVNGFDSGLSVSATREFSVGYNRRIISRHNEFDVFVRESLDGTESEFDSVSEDKLSNSYLKFKNELGEIEFREGIDLVSALNVRVLQTSEIREVDFDNLVDIIDKRIEVKTGEGGLNALNKKAHITFNNIGFSNYEIKKDGNVCSTEICKIISYDTNTKELVVEVSGFSVYEVVQKEQTPPTTQGGEQPSGGNGDGGGAVVPQGCDNDGVRETRQGEECDKNDFGLAGSNLCKDYDARYSSGVLSCSRCKVNITGCVIQPVVPPVNDTNVRTLPSWQRVLVGDTSYVNITDGENVVFKLEDVEEEYLVSFSIIEGRVQLEVVGERYDILIGDVFTVKLKDKEIYLGISSLSEDKAVLVVGLDENKVREIVIGYENKIRTVNFVLIGIVGLLIVVILVLIVVLVRRREVEDET